MNTEIWPLVIYFSAIVALLGGVLGVSHFLGQRRHVKATQEPFESGIVSVGSARLRLSVSFYVVAILFVIFDLETIYLFAWAIAFEEVGLVGFVEAMVFTLILLATLVYLWKMGALDWAPKQRSLAAKRHNQPILEEQMGKTMDESI